MSKKFKIKQNPTFKSEVELPLIGGNKVKIGLEFKYKTRKELAEMYDKWYEEAKNTETKEDATLAEVTELEMKLQVMQLKDILAGWEYEDEFNDENIEELVNTSVNISKVILDHYQEQYSNVKQGN